MNRSFFQQDVKTVAKTMIGMVLIRTFPDGHQDSYVITETEAYCGASDSACYAYKGRNKTSELLYHDGGTIFVHRCYGIHWMLNIVTGHKNDPQGVLIRGIEEIHGPGRVTKALELGNECNGTNITECETLSIVKGSSVIPCKATPRIGISYASKEDQDKLLRFVAIREETA